MTLETVIIFKVPAQYKKQINDLADSLQISNSALVRNGLALALLNEKKKPIPLERIAELAQEERRKFLLARSKDTNNGKKEN